MTKSLKKPFVLSINHKKKKKKSHLFTHNNLFTPQFKIILLSKMGSYMLGDNPLFKDIQSSEAVSAVLSSLCRSVSVSLCLQAALNNIHVFSAQTPLSLPSLCNTGHIIILRRNKNASAVMFLPSVSCHFVMLVTSTECTITQKKSL